MNALLAFSRGVDWFTERVGRGLFWLLLLAVIVSALNAISRYTLGIASNAWLELQWYLFAAIFMLGAGYVFLHDQHVRIDVLAGRLPRKAQVWIDVVGIVVFLIPLCLFVIWSSWPPVARAIETWEISPNPGGLLRWPLYILVPIGFTLLAMQSLSELFKRLAFLTGRGPDPHAKPELSAEQQILEELKREQELQASAAKAAGRSPA
jgi:TRAP-type mannitol/chloroaromatic compound transport system permease small subunit